MPDVLIDPRCVELGITVTPPPDVTRLHWRATHVWMTVNGSWEGVPQWAKPFQADYLGGATHIFMLGLEIGGTPTLTKDIFIQGWPDGMAKFSPEEGNGRWGNAIISAGFDWSKTTGPYYAQANAISSSVVHGLGLPYPPLPWQMAQTVQAQPLGGVHCSYCIVLQETAAEEPDGSDDGDNGDENGDGHMARYDAALDKAVAVADELAAYAGEDEQARLRRNVAAARIYLAVADSLVDLMTG